MLLLHIGRGKAGSTTIQHTTVANRHLLRERGILCPDGAVNYGGNYVPLVRALRENTLVPKELSDLLEANMASTIFISSEFLLTIRKPAIERLRQLAGPHEVRVLAYVRDYPSWVRSLYAQASRSGKNRLDFDNYYAFIRPLFSLKPQLGPWAEVFGWSRLVVRPVGPALTKSDLLDDFSEVLGIPLARSSDRNQSPNWLEVEFLRAIYSTLSDHRTKTNIDDIVASVNLFRHCLKKISSSNVEYLTLQQRRELLGIQNEDANWITKMSGQHFPIPQTKEAEERRFLPSFAHAPNEILASLAIAAKQDRFLNKNPTAAAAILEVCRRCLDKTRDHHATITSSTLGPDRFPWEF